MDGAGRGAGQRAAGADLDLDAEGQAIASAGIEAILADPSRTLPEIIELTGRRILDIGGGTGSWSIAAAQRHPDVQATVLDLPAVAALASGRVADAGLANRIDVLAADVLADALPVGYDTFLMANLVHYLSPETNRDLLRRIRAVAPGQWPPAAGRPLDRPHPYRAGSCSVDGRRVRGAPA